MKLIFFSSFLLIFSVSCAESYRTVFEENRETGESIRLYKFDRQSVDDSGRTMWDMNAEEAYIFRKNDTETKIVAYNFHFVQYSTTTGKIQTDLQAGRGEIDNDSNKVFLSGGVVFKETPTRYGETSSMEYDMGTKIITSNEKVVIYDDGRTTRCLKGIEVDKENEREVCKGPAVIQRQQEGADQSQEPNDLFD